MRNMKGELEARVAQIEADLQVLELAKTKSVVPSGDNSSLDDIKRMLNDLEEDTSVQLRALELREKYHKTVDVAPSESSKDTSADDEVIKNVRKVTGGENKTESAGD